ncbi:MAG: hypothetical protein ACD_75C01785G0002 [uncultured bacterium]|nr:MAG: hypothetical protein ACD_75C01785G0002 [uncultured bacterium]
MAVAAIVIGLLLQFDILALQCLVEGLDGGVIHVVLVGGSAVIILQLRVVRGLFQQFAEIFGGRQVVAAAVGIFAIRSVASGAEERNEQEKEDHNLGLPFHQAAERLAQRDRPCLFPFADQHFRDQYDSRQCQRPLESFDGDLVPALGQFFLGDQGQFLPVDRLETLARTERGIKAAALFGDGREGLLIEPGGDEVARRVLDEAFVPGAAEGNQFTLFGADADGMDGEALCRRFLGGFYRIAFEVFPVGDDDENLVIGCIAEHFHGAVDDLDDIGAALGDELGIHGRQRLFEGIVIKGQRAHEIGGAGKGQEPHPVAVQPADEIEDRQMRPLQPVRFHVLGEHALRGIEGKEQVDALAFHIHPPLAVLRPG